MQVGQCQRSCTCSSCCLAANASVARPQTHACSRRRYVFSPTSNRFNCPQHYVLAHGSCHMQTDPELLPGTSGRLVTPQGETLLLNKAPFTVAVTSQLYTCMLCPAVPWLQQIPDFLNTSLKAPVMTISASIREVGMLT